MHHLAGPPDWLEAQQRIAGWRDALDAAGAARYAPPARATGARARATSSAGSCSSTPDVTAIFVANDQMALGLLRALHEPGRDVPGDVSIVGFDDIPESAYFTPPLTTVRQDFNEMGRRGLHLLLEEIDGRQALDRARDRARLAVVRASTAPPASVL